MAGDRCYFLNVRGCNSGAGRDFIAVAHQEAFLALFCEVQSRPEAIQNPDAKGSLHHLTTANLDGMAQTKTNHCILRPGIEESETRTGPEVGRARDRRDDNPD